jgi:hypothetical protein
MMDQAPNTAPCVRATLFSLPMLAALSFAANAAEVDLDCSKGFAVLVSEVKTQPETKSLPDSPQFEAYSLGFSIYSVTKQAHPAHPTIVRRKIVEKDKAFNLTLPRAIMAINTPLTN